MADNPEKHPHVYFFVQKIQQKTKVMSPNADEKRGGEEKAFQSIL